MVVASNVGTEPCVPSGRWLLLAVATEPCVPSGRWLLLAVATEPCVPSGTVEAIN
jgi:hypothetical protein